MLACPAESGDSVKGSPVLKAASHFYDDKARRNGITASFRTVWWKFIGVPPKLREPG
jgi:hypothetical protein